jgi:hypothetical protein
MRFQPRHRQHHDIYYLNSSVGLVEFGFRSKYLTWMPDGYSLRGHSLKVKFIAVVSVDYISGQTLAREGWGCVRSVGRTRAFIHRSIGLKDILEPKIQSFDSASCIALTFLRSTDKLLRTSLPTNDGRTLF